MGRGLLQEVEQTLPAVLILLQFLFFHCFHVFFPLMKNITQARRKTERQKKGRERKGGRKEGAEGANHSL